MRENLGVYGCNNLSYSGTFSVVLTARGFLPNLGFPRISCVVIFYLFILSYLFFCLLTLLFAMSYGHILGTVFLGSELSSTIGIRAIWFGDGDFKSLREIIWRTWWNWDNDHGCLVWV